MYRVTLLNYETRETRVISWNGLDANALGAMVDKVRDETGSEFWSIHQLRDLEPQGR